MKRCPECGREYDNTISFCLDDGAGLLYGPASMDEPATAILSEPSAIAGGQFGNESAMRAQIHSTDMTAVLPTGAGDVVPQSRSLDKRLLVVPLLVAIVVLAGFFGYRYFKPSGGGAINSIAVLPFQNKSDDPDTDYLSDGLAESLIFRLSQLPGLKVSPASSVIRYKGKETDVNKVAAELAVDAVMTGRLVKRGDNLNLSVELVDVRNNRSLWGEQYERKMSELLATQREIATEITQNLKLKLSGADEQKLAKKYTDNDEAYQLYLRGRFHFARRSKDDLLKAIDYYQQAIRFDPNFALAYAGICYAYTAGTDNSIFSRDQGFPMAKDAARKAIEIDPDLAEAHSALGYVLSFADWNWSESEREHNRAIELDPNNANAHYYYGFLLEQLGRTTEAVREIKAAVDLEPMSLIINANLAAAYMYDRQNEKALVQARKTFDLDQNFSGSRVWLSHVYCANKMYVELIDLYEGTANDEAKRSMAHFAAIAYSKTGRRTEAEILKLPGKAENGGMTSYQAATIYAVLGDRNKAFAELEKAFAIKEKGRIRVDPLLEDLRDDPRFADLIRRMNFPQ